jgi:hypothetical protein
MIDRNYNAVLTRNPQNEQYHLKYEGVGGVTKELSATSLDALSSAMSGSGDFSATACNEIKTKDKQIPAVVYADCKVRGVAGGADGLALIKETLTNFFINPTQDNYRAILGIRARYYQSGGIIGDSFSAYADYSMRNTLSKLSPEIFSKISSDTSGGLIRALAAYPADPRFDIFTRRQ